MNIIALLDKFDFEDFKNLNFKSNFDESIISEHQILFVNSLEEFEKNISINTINIVSLRLLLNFSKQLENIIKNNSKIYFRFYEIDKFENIPDSFFDIKNYSNVVSHEYCIADLFNELKEIKLMYSKKEIEDNPESFIENLYLPTHKGNRCWLTNDNKNYF